MTTFSTTSGMGGILTIFICLGGITILLAYLPLWQKIVMSLAALVLAASAQYFLGNSLFSLLSGIVIFFLLREEFMPQFAKTTNIVLIVLSFLAAFLMWPQTETIEIFPTGTFRFIAGVLILWSCVQGFRRVLLKQ